MSSASTITPTANKPRPIEQDIYTATSMGDLDLVRKLLDSSDDINLNKTNRGGWTPLMYAAYYGWQKILELLLGYGSDVQRRSKNLNQTALMLAAMSGNKQCCQTLIHHRANVNDADSSCCTPLVYAVGSGYFSVVQILIACNSNVNVVTSGDKMTPLLISALTGNQSIARLLIHAGANLNAVSATNKTPITLARENGYPELVQLFQSYCTVPEVPSDKTKSPVSPNLLEPPFPDTLNDLLDLLGLSAYMDTFQQRGIDLSRFLTLKEDNLKEFGITKLGPRRKLANAITRLNSFPRNTNDYRGGLNYEQLHEMKTIFNIKCLNDDRVLSAIFCPLYELQLKTLALKATVNDMKSTIEFSQKELLPELSEGLTETERISNDINAQINNMLEGINKLRSF